MSERNRHGIVRAGEIRLAENHALNTIILNAREGAVAQTHLRRRMCFDHVLVVLLLKNRRFRVNHFHWVALPIVLAALISAANLS